jgi:hypothetical protein
MMKPLKIHSFGKPRKIWKGNKYFWALGCENKIWVKVARHCSSWWSWTLWFSRHKVIQLALVYLYWMVLTRSTSVAIDSDAFSSADVSLPVTFWTTTCLGMYTVWACNRNLAQVFRLFFTLVILANRLKMGQRGKFYQAWCHQCLNRVGFLLHVGNKNV